MIGEIVLLLVASAAAMVAVVSSQRAIARHRLALERAGAAPARERRRLGERVDAVYRSIEAQLEPAAAVGAPMPSAVRGGGGPVAADADVAVAFLRRHLGSADDDEVQRLLPMLQLLEQRALERAAEVHPRVGR